MLEFLKRSFVVPALFIGLAVSIPASAEKVETPRPAEHVTTEHVTAEHHATAQPTAAHKAETGEEHERPLLDFRPAEAIWIIIIFCVLLAILYKTAWKNVLAGLKAREERIRKDISDAEAARAKSELALQEYSTQLATAEQKVRELLQGAAVEGERIATQIKTKAQQEVEATRERATKDIEAAKRQAIQDIYAQAATLSTSIAEKILRRNLNADDQRDLVNQSLEQLQEVH